MRIFSCAYGPALPAPILNKRVLSRKLQSQVFSEFRNDSQYGLRLVPCSSAICLWNFLCTQLKYAVPFLDMLCDRYSTRLCIFWFIPSRNQSDIYRPDDSSPLNHCYPQHPYYTVISLSLQIYPNQVWLYIIANYSMGTHLRSELVSIGTTFQRSKSTFDIESVGFLMGTEDWKRIWIMKRIQDSL